MEIDDATLQRLRQLLAPDFARRQTIRELPSASFPGNQTDGARVKFRAEAATLTNATTDVIWTFVYSASDGYWYPDGAIPISAQVGTPEATASVAYAALATAGPSLSIPFAGDYRIEHGAGITCPVAAGAAAIMSYDIGVTGAVDADYVAFTSPGIAQLASVARANVHTGVPALTAFVSKYKSPGGGGVTFEKRWMKITPLRCR